jgi:uncharacterized membrane protein YczE
MPGLLLDSASARSSFHDTWNIYDMSCIIGFMTYHEILPLWVSSPGLRRVNQLGIGLILFGVSIAVMLAAGLGVDSWDVLHQAVAGRIGISFGWVVITVSLAVLAVWIPLRQRPGLGTVANALVVGLVADATLAALPEPRNIAWQLVMLVTGIAGNGIATGLYIGAGLGPGPRDGLMTGLADRTGRSVRLVRTLIEVSVLAAGWALGGPVGVGTLLYALSIGPISQWAIVRFSIPEETR